MLTIAMPVHDSIDARTMLSWGATMADLTRRGVAFTVEMVFQDPSVARARNTLAAAFLRSKSDRLLFIDADMTWTPADVQTLLACDEDVIGGAYAKKSGGVCGVPIAGIGKPGDVLVECERLGTGFMTISRDCLERMVTAYPETAYLADTGHVVHNLFGEHISNAGYYLQDDWSFCSRWKGIGGRILMHTGVRPGHIGTHVYTLKEAPHG